MHMDKQYMNMFSFQWSKGQNSTSRTLAFKSERRNCVKAYLSDTTAEEV